MIKWSEPDEKGRTMNRTISEEEAIARQKAIAEKRGYKYLSDDEALNDFIACNWAWRSEAR